MTTPRILVLSGPNLQLLGMREPEVYGRTTLHGIHGRLEVVATELGVSVDCKQSNAEGDLCTWIGEAGREYAGVLLNAAALSHTSVVLLDAVLASGVPCVDVHLSNYHAREEFRRPNLIARVAVGSICGFGSMSYELGLRALVAHLERTVVAFETPQIRGRGGRA